MPTSFLTVETMAFWCRLMDMSSSPRTGLSFWELLVMLKVYKKFRSLPGSTCTWPKPSFVPQTLPSFHLSTSNIERLGIGGPGVHSLPLLLQQLAFPTFNMVWICTCPPPPPWILALGVCPLLCKILKSTLLCIFFSSLTAPSYIVTRSMPVASIFRLKKMTPTPIPQLAMTTVGGLQMRSMTAEVIKILAGRKILRMGSMINVHVSCWSRQYTFWTTIDVNYKHKNYFMEMKGMVVQKRYYTNKSSISENDVHVATCTR